MKKKAIAWKRSCPIIAQENSVRAVERALAILDAYTEGKNGFTLMELARRNNLSPSTTLRILATMEKAGYLYRNPENLRYYSSFKLAQISNASFENLDFCRVARPFMERLCDRFHEGVGLYVMRGNRRICVDRVEGDRRLRSVLHIGDTAPLNCGASGRLLLAHCSESQLCRILPETSAETVEALRKIRERGYAVSYGEREPGVVSVASPLFNAKGEVVAALFLTGAAIYMNDEVIDQIIAAITESAREISRLMGFRTENP